MVAVVLIAGCGTCVERRAEWLEATALRSRKGVELARGLKAATLKNCGD